jgi:hypothetical protein
MTTLSLADFSPRADGVADDTAALRRCFDAAARAPGCTVVIPAGCYSTPGEAAVALPSHVRVEAHGARFLLPDTLEDGARRTVFAAENLVDFRWNGGEFLGHCFDRDRRDNPWPPNANTRVFAVTTSPGGVTDDLAFADLRAEGIAGAVIHVAGVAEPGSESAVHTYATRVTVRDCLLRDCGKFMWDYGLLWQILVWPEDYPAEDVAMAERYFRHDLLRGPVRMADGGDRVEGVGAIDGEPSICFFGDVLPRNIVRGRSYRVVAADVRGLAIAETPDGPPLVFAGAAGPNTRAIVNLNQAFYHLFQPVGAGPGKGGLDLVCCRDTRVVGNTLSALGDTMHLQRCRTNTFSHNHIAGSRMGAFFLAEYCQDSTVLGNTVDGTNGSRVMSVEKSNTDVTIVGNTFRNGGRGSWINQPQRLVMTDNIFVNNTTKAERDPRRGRKSALTGDYEPWPELYFTTHEPNGTYGPVVLRGNLFAPGPDCGDLIVFHAGGHTLLVADNVVAGPPKTLRVLPGCERPEARGNVGIEVVEG